MARLKKIDKTLTVHHKAISG